MEQIYVIKVKCAPPSPSQILPSERRYSANSVLGLACVHFILTILTTILVIMRIHSTGDFFWPIVLVILTSCSSGVSGILAWHRWYQGIFIRCFLVCATISCCTCSAVILADILTVSTIRLAVVHNVIISCIFTALWSLISCVVAWKGVRNKNNGDEIFLPNTTPLKPTWNLNDDNIKKESQARVIEYLRSSNRPPVEGKEKSAGDDDVNMDPS